jgi:hypothetical protein
MIPPSAPKSNRESIRRNSKWTHRVLRASHRSARLPLRSCNDTWKRVNYCFEYVLGDRSSYVMAITQKTEVSYSLPGKNDLETRARQYRKAIGDKASATALGDALFQSLLGVVPEYRKPDSSSSLRMAASICCHFQRSWRARNMSRNRTPRALCHQPRFWT